MKDKYLWCKKPNPYVPYIPIITQVDFSMASLPNNMCEAYSTTNVGNDGLHLFNTCHKNNSKPFVEDMTEEYLEEDNIKSLLTDYSNWLATTDIPNYFYE